MRLLKPFLHRGLGQKLPFLRNLFYKQFSQVVVRIKSPITIPGGYSLYLPPNGIDYIIEPYEELEIELVRNNLKEGDTFLDIGAGIGYYTVITSKIVGDKGKVIAFEPDPQYHKFIQKNLKENKCNNVVLFQKAVSNRTGKTKFYLYDKIGRNRIEEVNYLLSDFKVRDCIKVETVKLDELLDEKIDFIKVDIEGSQYLALEGMKGLIKKNPQIKMIIEVPDYKRSEFFESLENLGFRIYKIDNKKKAVTEIRNIKGFVRKVEEYEVVRNTKEEEIRDLFCEKA